MKYCKDTYQPKLGVQREGSLLCSCSEFKETEMQRSYGLWTWEEQTKKALTVLRLRVTNKNWQNENCQWFLKKTRKLFLLMPQLSSVIAAVPSFNLHFMHTLRFLSSVWVEELLICLYPPAHVFFHQLCSRGVFGLKAEFHFTFTTQV